jgi:hypothetical protein
MIKETGVTPDANDHHSARRYCCAPVEWELRAIPIRSTAIFPSRERCENVAKTVLALMERGADKSFKEMEVRAKVVCVPVQSSRRPH